MSNCQYSLCQGVGSVCCGCLAFFLCLHIYGFLYSGELLLGNIVLPVESALVKAWYLWWRYADPSELATCMKAKQPLSASRPTHGGDSSSSEAEVEMQCKKKQRCSSLSSCMSSSFIWGCKPYC